MNPISSDLLETKVQPGLSPDQRTWLKKLGTLVGGPAASSVAPAKAAAPARPALAAQSLKTGATPGGKSALVEGFSPLDIPADILKTPEELLGPLSCTCLINNNTEKDLLLDPDSRTEIDGDSKGMGLAHGEYDDFPPSVIKGNDQSSKFKAVNKETNLLVIKIHTAGVEGRVRYFIGDKKTSWTIHFNNPRTPGGNSADAKIEGENATQFDTPKPAFGNGADAKFLYVLDPKGGPSPKPGPQPGPSGAKSSCLITVNNNTQQVLALADQGHDSGDFVTFPAPSLQPGASTQFVFVQTPDTKDEDCKGFLSWEVGSPSAAIWRNEWHNPKGEKNTANASAEPQSAGFRTLAQAGEGDENVPFVFSISGGAAGPGPKPEPKPEPEPEPEPDVIAPPGSRQPTLRKGDKSADGWVEFLQQQLNLHLGLGTVDVDGNFGPATEKAVRTFQAKNNLQVDGTTGNQTWAALRGAPAEAPSTDGRAPHTFVEQGPQARWDDTKDDAVYDSSSDTLLLFANSVGAQTKLDDFNAFVKVTAPGAKTKTVKVKIGPPDVRTKTDQGDEYTVKVPGFKKKFPTLDKNGKPIPDPKLEDYVIEAFFDKELGPDLFKGKIVVA